MEHSLPTHVHLALQSLEGLSIGDAFGDQFFIDPDEAEEAIQNRRLPRPPWGYTDDTVMAISIVDVLERRDFIDQALLAAAFGARYRFDPYRRYGGSAHS